MKVVARFDPPGALERLNEWRDDNLKVLESIPPEEIRVEKGRMVGGTFAQVSVGDDFADRFTNPSF